MSAEQQPSGQDVTDDEMASAITTMSAALNVANNPDLDDSLRGLGEHVANTIAERYNT